MTLTIGWVQYNSDYAAYLPYAVGLLQAYIQHHAPDQYRFLIPRVFAAPIAEEVQHLLSADVVGFSCYVWNIERSLALAAELKRLRPEVLVVFGGPQVPDIPKDFLTRYPQVDVCCRGEGEQAFLELMAAYAVSTHPKSRQTDFSPQGTPVAGMAGHDAQGKYYQNAPPRRRNDLDALPSPYLVGTFDPLMAAHPQVEWSILWETNRGCPFTCGFCDWGSATAAKVHRFDIDRLKAELNWFAAQKIGYIFCCDANFGIFPRDLALTEYAVALHQRTGFPGALAVQNAKNVSERTFAIQCLLAESGLDSHVTLSLQSLYPPALKASGRANISLEDFERLQSQLRARRIHTYTDLILSLPGETLDSFITGYGEVIERGQYHAINVYVLDLLPNAPMADPAFRAQHGLKTVRVPSVNFHRPVKAKDPDGIVEWQELVVATNTLPAADWARARAFIWWAELLFFKPGLLRIPFLLLHRLGQLPIKDLLLHFMQAQTPLMSTIDRYFMASAKGIQQGQPVYTAVSEQISGGPMYWKGAYDGMLQLLIQDQQLGNFYVEAEFLLKGAFEQVSLELEKTHTQYPLHQIHTLWQDVLFLSASYAHLLHEQDLPGVSYTTHWNVWDVYQGFLDHQEVPLAPLQQRYYKPWEGAPWRLRSEQIF